MNRLIIMDILEEIAPCYPIGMHYERELEPYIVLKTDTQDVSLESYKGGWQLYDVMCYVPDISIVGLDEFVVTVVDKLKEYGVKMTGNLSPDFHDVEIEMYMRSIYVRIPKEVN